MEIVLEQSVPVNSNAIRMVMLLLSDRSSPVLLNSAAENFAMCSISKMLCTIMSAGVISVI